MSITIVVFWSCALALLYLYAGYPALIRTWAALRPRAVRNGGGDPDVSVLVAVRNEEAVIADRIRNLLSLDYPGDRLEVLVGSDGSDDGTAEAASAFRRAGVRVFAFRRRRGKASVLNDLAREARGAILVFGDARQRFDPGSLRALVSALADPAVGAVSGELILAGDPRAGAVAEGVGFYWRYEKLIRRSESRVDSTVGATGAIYAIRRELFEPIPADTILDDVLIPIRIVRRGYRVLFEPSARAYDRPASTAAEEFARKARTIAGNFQLLARERWLLDPFRNRLWFQTLSHKGLRLVSPLLLAGLLASSVVLAGSPLYAAALSCQILFYAMAGAGYLLRRSPRRPRLASIPYVVCLLNWATVVGFSRFAAGRQSAAWEKARAATPSPGREVFGAREQPAPSPARRRHA